MKRFAFSALCLILMTISSFVLHACDVSGNNEVVKLVAVTAQEVGLRGDIDYYVVPEPAASVKTAAMDGLEFSGSLQELYGNKNRYPQAVAVAKTELLGTAVLEEFITALDKNGEWLLDENTSPETVSNAVKSHLSQGMSPTFTAKNLTKTVIKNCSVAYVSADSCKAEITSFIQKLNGVSPSSFGEPSDDFFYSPASFAGEYTGKIKVYAPDGAPALALANMLAGSETPNGAEMDFEVVDASIIHTFVTGANPQADICILPVNLAVKLLGGGEKYKLLGTLTHGNLYLLSNGKTGITPANMLELRGKTVGVINLAQIPGLTFKLILKNNSLEYSELK